MTTYAKGQKVNVINSTMSGRFFLEGQATIVRAVDENDYRYIVRFKDKTEKVERFVDPEAQFGDVGQYIANLNDGTHDA